MKKLIVLTVAIALPATVLAQDELRFAIDPASPSVSGNLTPDDVLVAGPVVRIEGTSLGLQDNFLGGVFDSLDALSHGREPIVTPLYFSADRVAVGLPGSDVYLRALPGVEDAARHVYVSQPPFGSNLLAIDGGGLGLQGGFFGDDLGALGFNFVPGDNTYFSIDYLSASLSPTIRPGDIFIDHLSQKFAPFATLGIDSDDDLDALVLFDIFNHGTLNRGVDIAIFSLHTFSPSTFTGSGTTYIPGVKGHLSPADILITSFTGSFGLFRSAADMGWTTVATSTR